MSALPEWLGALTSFRFVFFILGAGWQVRGVHECHGSFTQGRVGQKFPKQMVVDLPKTGRAQGAAKLIEHAHIRDSKPIGQMGKAAPLLLLGQATDQRIETKGTCQQNQQMNSPELSGAETKSPALAALASETFVDEFIRDVRGENTQQFRGADRWKLHARHATQ